MGRAVYMPGKDLRRPYSLRPLADPENLWKQEMKAKAE